MAQKPTLKKDLNLLASTALVIGMAFGSGIFMKSGKVIAAAGDSTLALTAWALGSLITIAAGLTVAELGAQIPRTGGLYAYLGQVYGGIWGFLFGWIQTFIYNPAIIGMLSLYFSLLLLPFFGLSKIWQLPVAIATIVFLGGINAVGIKYGGLIQSTATVIKLIPAVLIAVFGLSQGSSQILNMPSDAGEAAGMGAAVLATLWAYEGWINVSFVAGEMKNPATQLPRAIIAGLFIVMIAYQAVNLALLSVLPAAEIVLLGNYAASTAAGLIFGEIGGRLINVWILISIFAVLNGYILTGARVPYAMACDGLLLGAKIWSKVHSVSGVPVNALALSILLAVIVMIFCDSDRLTNIAIFIVWLFYILAFAAVFVLRKRYPRAARPYRVPCYPLTPLVAISGSICIAAGMLVNNFSDVLYAFAIILIGLPVYKIMKNNK